MLGFWLGGALAREMLGKADIFQRLSNKRTFVTDVDQLVSEWHGGTVAVGGMDTTKEQHWVVFV